MQAGKSSGLTIGIVCEREEDGLGRIKVRYPTRDDRESDWCRVAVPFGGTDDSGATYGFQWVPNMHDEVLVMHQEEDPKIPIVVGTVYSKKNKPPTGKPNERVLQDAKGQKLMLREDDTTIVLDNGHTITMSADGQKIEIKSKNEQYVLIDDKNQVTEIKAPKVIVKAGSVELVKG